MKKAVNVAIGRYIVANKAYNHYCLVCNHKDEDIKHFLSAYIRSLYHVPRECDQAKKGLKIFSLFTGNAFEKL